MAVAVVMTSNNPTTKAVIMFGIIVVVLTLTRFIQCDVQARTSRSGKESYLLWYVNTFTTARQVVVKWRDQSWRTTARHHSKHKTKYNRYSLR